MDQKTMGDCGVRVNWEIVAIKTTCVAVILWIGYEFYTTIKIFPKPNDSGPGAAAPQATPPRQAASKGLFAERSASVEEVRTTRVRDTEEGVVCYVARTARVSSYSDGVAISCLRER